MIALRVTFPVEEERAEVDGAEGVGGAADLDHLVHSYISLRLTIAAFMAHMTWKWLDTGKGIGKWLRILMIAEGKMSLSRVSISLYTSMMERTKWNGKSIVRCSNKESKNRARGSVIKL